MLFQRESGWKGGMGGMPIFTFISNQNPCKIIIIQSWGFHQIPYLYKDTFSEPCEGKRC